MMHYFKYIDYVFRHKFYVLIECFKRGIFLRGILHDLSKFLPSEFFAYSEFLYNPKTITTHDEFRKAVLLHKRRNKHHWEYWVMRDDAKYEEVVFPMDIDYATEMICDWVGTGKAVGNLSPKNDPYKEVREWYIEHNDQLVLHPYTRNYIESTIGYSAKSKKI